MRGKPPTTSRRRAGVTPRRLEAHADRQLENDASTKHATRATHKTKQQEPTRHIARAILPDTFHERNPKMASSKQRPPGWLEDGRRAFASSAAGSAAVAAGGGGRRPEHVGIIAADFYVPDTFVSQAALEEADGVPAGKYTKGLMQARSAQRCRRIAARALDDGRTPPYR